MFVITVRFEIESEHLDEFKTLMMQQAANSLEKEAGCHQFDVCYSPDQTNVCFLYEKYTDLAAFDEHLASEHFVTFDKAVAAWVIDKQVGTWLEQTT
ncbi:MAG: putative quinol monooxygenase [Planctomycetota bacterium]